MLAKVYINLIDQKEPTLDFKTTDTRDNNENKKVMYNRKIVVPSVEELNNHSQYLKVNLKKNFFN